MWNWILLKWNKLIYHLSHKTIDLIFGLLIIAALSVALTHFAIFLVSYFYHDISPFNNKIISILTFVILMFIVPTEYSRRHVFLKGKQDIQIKKYMSNWIGMHGVVVIFTHDLSWVSKGDELYNSLIQKKENLIVCAPNEKKILSDLESSGCKIYYYKSSPPALRFTIVDYKKHGSKVAIGYADGKYHIIEEYSDNTITYKFSRDLYEIIENAQKSR